MFKYAANRKILIFHTYFFNMDNSLIMRHICLKNAINVLQTHLEGWVSQNFDIGLSFNLIASIRGDFQNISIKSQNLPVFCSKTKTRTYMKNLGHSSLDKNVFYTY